MVSKMRSVIGVLLAAGRGTRFGGDKLRARLTGHAHGLTVGVAAGTHLLEALPMSVAVIRTDDEPLARDLSAIGLSIARCDRADDGMGVSLACGVNATSDADGWVVALADMPWIAPATIRAIAEEISSGADIAAPSYRGVRGHPVGFSRLHYEALVALTGDAGARSIIERARAALTLIDVDDPGVLRDVDAPTDLANISDDALLRRPSTR